MSKVFNFVIARPWYPEKEFPSPRNVCIYSYGSEILTGTKEDAEEMLNYVRAQYKLDGAEDVGNEYEILKVKYKRLK